MAHEWAVLQWPEPHECTSSVCARSHAELLLLPGLHMREHDLVVECCKTCCTFCNDEDAE